ncbi:MAG: hypothetical protein ABW007_07500 [Chitinophagaceae bacterium]
MRWRSYFFCCSVFALCSWKGMAVDVVAADAALLSRKYLTVVEVDTTGKQFRPPDRFPVEKQFRIVSEEKEFQLPGFKKGDVIRISTKNGLKHYRNKRLLNTYKIVPQPTIIKIQPQCKVAPCPPIDSPVLVYHMGHAERYIDIRNNSLLISDSTYKDPDPSTKALRIKWRKAYGLSSQ